MIEILKLLAIFIAVLAAGMIFVAALLLPVALTVYGLYLAFKEDTLLGIIAVLLHPLPLVLGALALLKDKQVAHKLAVWLKISKPRRK